MRETLTEALSDWLNYTFNDYYQVWSPQDYNQYIVEHKPDTPNEKFLELLKKIYTKFNFEDAGFMSGPTQFVIRHGSHDIEIEGFDNTIRHTSAI